MIQLMMLLGIFNAHSLLFSQNTMIDTGQMPSYNKKELL
jgi:hypothetical protein